MNIIEKLDMPIYKKENKFKKIVKHLQKEVF